MTTPAPQRRTVRRADRYKQDSSVPPSTELMQHMSAPASPPVPKAPPPAARTPQTDRTGLTDVPRRRVQSAQMRPQPVQSVQPVMPQRMAVPPAPQPASAQPKQPAAKMPRWLFLSLIACVFIILSMITASSLMEAYLTTRQQEREAAYQRVLNNHPLEFKETIERYAAENNLHPAFVAAIILNESSFRTGATSSVGARGLMQLMPDTAEWIAGKLDDYAYDFDDMYTAEKNIQYGTWYLNYLAKLFRGDPILIAAAYHAGQGEVIGWLSDPSMSKDGVTIALDDMIEGNTRIYVGRVTQAYAIYEAIYYPEEADGSADGSAAARISAVR